MTITEAQKHIGDIVVYRPYLDAMGQSGTIVRVSRQYVFVRYGHNDSSIQATPPEMITLL